MARRSTRHQAQSGRVQDLDARPSDLQHSPVVKVGVRRAIGVRQIPQHAVIRMQQDLGRKSLQLGSRAHVVVVCMGARDRDDGTPGYGTLYRLWVVRRVKNDDLVVVAEDPDVVLDLVGPAIHAERPARAEVLHPERARRTTTRGHDPTQSARPCGPN